MERRLAAILAADVVGYSRMIRADEEGTLHELRALREELIDPKIQEYRGRIVKLMGDGLLAEFASVVDAVACSAEVQSAIAERNPGTGDTGPIVLRVGINLGDVVIDGDDIQGDGVNVAARLEALAQPGGICISDAVYEQVRDRLDLKFQDLGQQEVKNIDRPVQTWGWIAASTEAQMQSSSNGASLPLPDKPSIAVLPFDNMSGDVEQEYFADGMTEDITTALSRIRWLFVIARNSSFAYKGKSVDVRQVAGELGVRYVLEGSVRKGGNRLRVTAQLIDASSGVHVWAERFDREIKDVFVLQDDITDALMASIEPELAKAEQQRAIRKPVENLDAWSWFQRGLWHHYRATKADNDEALRQIGKAIELDPNFSRALAALAHVHYWNALFGYTEHAKENLETGLSLAKRAVVADDKEPFAHFALGRISTLRGDLDTAIAELELAIELSPSFAHAYYGLGNALNFAGRAEEAIKMTDRAIRLNPHDPASWTFMSGRAWSLMFLGRFEEAHEWALKGVRQANAGWLSHAIVACTFAELGHTEEAEQAVSSTLAIKPDFRISFVAETYPFREDSYRDCFVTALRKAGFAE